MPLGREQPAEPRYTVKEIIELAGGAIAIGERTDRKKQAIYLWYNSDENPGIRDTYWDDLADLALEHSKVELTAQDFFEANKLARSQAIPAAQPKAAE